MADVLKQQELGDNQKKASDSHKYDASEVVIASCTNGTPAPTQPCQVALELSTDDVLWVAGARKQYGPVESTTYLAAFPLSQFAETGAWRHYRLAFGGNVGGAVQIAASTGEAPMEKEEKPDRVPPAQPKK
jgi:hypothetical protein